MSQPGPLNPLARGFLERVVSASSATQDFSGLSKWLQDNTTDPRDSTKPWSFKDHEFQIDILNDGRPRVVVRKCSQVGLSEVVVRLQLAILAVFNNVTAIYTLPTTSFARQFTKSRIDPVIDNSPVLRGMVPAKNDSSELKQLGSSFLYVRGSFGQGAAISIPADVLINDEVDFSNQQALTTFASRLGHASMGEGHGIRREFSTPTVDGYGISKSYDASTQARYMVRCDGCSQWVAPDFFDDVVIPGFDQPLIELEAMDLQADTVDIDGSHLLCPSCRGVLTVENLANPAKRGWVEQFPGREVGGYQVMPFDVPVINPVAKTLRALGDYERKADWVNFKLGMPYEDAESSFLRDRIDRYTRLRAVSPHQQAAQGCVMGVDVGKTSWVLIGKPEQASMKILWAERIVQDGADHLHQRLMELLDCFGVHKAVVDAAPDFTTALKLIEANYEERVYGNYYVHSTGAKLTERLVDDKDSLLKTDRNRSFDALSKAVNGGLVEFPVCKEMELVRDHLMAMKRVSEYDGNGELKPRWTSTGADHYAHALNYLRLAEGLLDHRGKHSSVAALPMAAKSRVQSGSEGMTRHPLMQGNGAGYGHGRY